MPRTSVRWALWGFHPAYRGKDGFPYPLKLAIGSERACNGERARREKQGGWTLGRYRQGVPPTGLRLQCDALYPERSRLGEAQDGLQR